MRLYDYMLGKMRARMNAGPVYDTCKIVIENKLKTNTADSVDILLRIVSCFVHIFIVLYVLHTTKFIINISHIY